MPETHWTLAECKQEQWIFRRLDIEYPPGITTFGQRVDMIRQSILNRGIAEELAVTANRRSYSWRQIFKRAYNCELEPALL